MKLEEKHSSYYPHGTVYRENTYTNKNKGADFNV